MLPKYDCLRCDRIYGLTVAYEDLWVPWYGGAVHCTVFFGFVHGRKCFFIEPHSADRFFDRGQLYGSDDDVSRFAFFSRAALEFMLKSGKRPEIIHCHDDPTRVQLGGDCGSRRWSDRALIERVLRLFGPAVIVHGAAPGADRTAASVAARLSWPVEQHPADWQRYRKSAGPRRNLEMLDTRPVLVIAFTVIAGGTAGTRHTLTNAYRRGIPVVVVTPQGHVTTYTLTQPRRAGERLARGAIRRHAALLPDTATHTEEGHTMMLNVHVAAGADGPKAHPGQHT